MYRCVSCSARAVESRATKRRLRQSVNRKLFVVASPSRKNKLPDRSRVEGPASGVVGVRLLTKVGEESTNYRLEAVGFGIDNEMARFGSF